MQNYQQRLALTKTAKYRNTLRASREIWADFRAMNGLARRHPGILSSPDDVQKFDITDVAVYGLSFAPSRASGVNVCPHSTPNCVKACVAYNGNGAFKSVQFSRALRVRFWKQYPSVFKFLVSHEIFAAVKRHNGNVEFRMNTLSDVEWQDEAPEWFRIPGASFYDYTKNWDRVSKFDNYSICYSVTERTPLGDIFRVLDRGDNVALVVNVRGGKIPHTNNYREIPTTWHGYNVIDGDVDDNRSADPRGSVVMLRAKGRMNGLAMAREAIPTPVKIRA